MFDGALYTAPVVFREIIEIALILGVVMAATRGMEGRLKLTLAGLGIGCLGAVAIAFFTDTISQAVEGVGQEIFNATIMFVAVGFLSWTVIWMKTHGRKLAQNLREMGQAVVNGNKSAYVLVGVIALATFREGAEIVLFTYAMTASGAYSVSSVVMGGIAGGIGGAIVGTMFYFGLLKAAQKYLFTVTSWMLIFLTAGMAAQGAAFLIQADILPTLIPTVWDTSAIISGQSFLGEMLSILIGYTPRPTGMELLFYTSALLTIGLLYTFMGKQTAPKRIQNTVPAAAE